MSIEDLPDEILIEIFSSVSFEDLVQNVRLVCSRWKDVAQDTLLWRERVYKPEYQEPDSKIADILKATPKLQTLILKNKGVSSTVLNAFLENCPYLRRLELCSDQRLSVRLLEKLLNKCSDIEYLRLPKEVFSNVEQGEIIGRFTKLKTLIVCGWDDRDSPVDVLLKPVADGCISLQHIDLEDKKVSSSDLHYFLEKKKNQLRTVCIRWSNADMKCNLPLLSVCTTLKTVCVDSYFEVDIEQGFKALRKLKSVTSLTLSFFNNAKVNDIISVFERKNMIQLEELTFSFYYNYEDRLADAIVRNCPKLKLLAFKDCANLTDRSVEKLHTLTTLQSLNLYGTCITDVGMEYIRKCKALRYLNLESCLKLTEESMKQMIAFSDLRVLKLGFCNIKGLPLNLISTQLRHLVILNINYCKNINKEALSQLRCEIPSLIIHSHEFENDDSQVIDDNESVFEDAAFLFENQ